MKNRTIPIGFLLYICMVSCYTIGQPTHQWSKAIGYVEGAQNQTVPTPDHMAINASGAIAIGGSYYGEDIDMDPSSNVALLPSVSLGGDTYFAKYDNEGNFEWAQMVEGNPQIEKIVLDENGQVYVVCDFFLDMDLTPNDPGGMITFQGGSDFVVFSYDSTGNFLWYHPFGNTGWDDADDMELLPNGNILIGGMVEDNPDLDPGSGSSITNGGAGTFDYFLLELDSNGDFVEGFEWGNTLGSSQEIFINEFEVSDNGEILLMVFAEDAVQLDPSGNNAPVSYSGIGQTVFLKLDASYNYLDHESLDDEIQVRDMEITPLGKIFFTGRFSQQKDIESGPGQTLLVPSSQGVFDSYIASYDENLSFVWAHQMNGNNSDLPEDIITTSNEEALLTGSFLPGMIYPDPFNAAFNLENTGPGTWTDVYFLKYDTLGNLLWSASTDEDYNALDPVVVANERDEIVLAYNYNGDSLDVDLTTGSYYMFTEPKGELFINKYFNCEPIDTTVQVNGVTFTAPSNGYNYQWVECDGQGSYTDIPGATQPSFTASQNGTYACRFTYLSCEFYSECETINSVSANEFPETEISVFPNPSKGEVWIKVTDHSEIESYEVYDLSGRSITSGIITSEKVKINTSLTEGLYILSIRKGAKEVYNEKMIVYR